MSITKKQQCKKCQCWLPMTRDYFGNTPNGNFRQQCRACMRGHVQKYSEANKEGVAERAQLRKTRMAIAGGVGYSDTDISKIRRLLSDRCAYCNINLNGGGHIDHKTPIAQGGKNDPSNLTICCEKCNLAKHAKNVDEFIKWRLQRGLSIRRPIQ